MGDEAERASEEAENWGVKEEIRELLEKQNSLTDKELRNHLYAIAQTSNKGEEVRCPGCGCWYTKKASKQVFCTSARKQKAPKCRDLYWNHVTPRKRSYAQWLGY